MDAVLKRCGDLGLMALAVWREARGEPYEGKLAVAYSILNRVARPSWWGKDILSVIGKAWQYSSMTDPDDLQLTAFPMTDETWEACLQACAEAMDNAVANPVPGADSYFDESIPAPYWAKAEMFVGKIGRLAFYDVDQDYERDSV